jgi:hypothetical protein
MTGLAFFAHREEVVLELIKAAWRKPAWPSMGARISSPKPARVR